MISFSASASFSNRKTERRRETVLADEATERLGFSRFDPPTFWGLYRSDCDFCCQFLNIELFSLYISCMVLVLDLFWILFFFFPFHDQASMLACILCLAFSIEVMSMYVSRNFRYFKFCCFPFFLFFSLKIKSRLKLLQKIGSLVILTLFLSRR